MHIVPLSKCIGIPMSPKPRKVKQEEKVLEGDKKAEARHAPGAPTHFRRTQS